jgi:drug/metabolite transporter (DMT)-like permease
MPVWFGFLIALVVNAANSLGMVLQKKGIGWQRKGRERDASWRRDRRIWLLGFLLVTVVPGLNFFALLALSPDIVGAMIGMNVAFTLLFSALLLEEKLKARGIAASAVMFASIVALVLFKGSAGLGAWSWPPLALVWAAPFAIAGIAWLLMRGRPARAGSRENTHSNSYGAVMGAVSGALSGAMFVFLKIAQLECSSNILRYAYMPYMYIYLTAALGGMYLMQIAYRHGSINAVAPAAYGSQVVYPVVATWLVFAGSPDLAQVACFVMIIGSVLVLAAGAGGKKQAAGERQGDGRMQRIERME